MHYIDPHLHLQKVTAPYHSTLQWQQRKHSRHHATWTPAVRHGGYVPGRSERPELFCRPSLSGGYTGEVYSPGRQGSGSDPPIRPTRHW